MNSYSVMGSTPGDGGCVKAENFVEALAMYTKEDCPFEEARADIVKAIADGNTKVEQDDENANRVFIGNYQITLEVE